MTVLQKVLRIIKTELCWTVIVLVMVTMTASVTSLSGPNVCMVKQKYNITKRVKYRAPMSVRTYEWCFAMPPRCSKWNTEMRDVTRLETEERTAEMAVCCPGYKLRDVSCVPHCPSGKTGQGCSEDCPPNKWGPSCVHECKICEHGSCDAVTGACRCQDGWQGESCETSMTTTAAAEMMEQLLTTEFTPTKNTSQTIPTTGSSTITSTAATISATSNDTALAANLSPMTTTILSSEEITSTKIATTSAKDVTSPISVNFKESTPISPTLKSNEILNNNSISTVPISTLNTPSIIESEEVTKEIKKTTVNHSSYNRTEVPSETNKTFLKTYATNEPIFIVKSDDEWTTLTPVHITSITSVVPVYQSNTKISTALTPTTTVKSSTRKLPTTVRQPMTTKIKAKEIWIKPAQKGESSTTKAKLKSNQELPLSKPKHEEMIEFTTPKTIIVSIIPTSVTYVTFKRIALTTASTKAQKNNISTANSINRSIENRSTKPMIVLTTSLPTTEVLTKKINISPFTNSSVLYQNVTKTNAIISSTRTFKTTTTTPQITNSMLSTLNVYNKRLNSSLLTSVSSFSTNVTKSRRIQHSLYSATSRTTAPFNQTISRVTETTIEKLTIPEQSVSIVQKNVTNRTNELSNVTETFIQKQANINNKRNIINSKTAIANTVTSVTDDPTKDEETFHILTEPEHITAVMGDKGNEKSTINLISVISIAGGVMMAVITVAIIIVMLDRCKKPRYEDVRKYNDIRMQVMIDNNDIPPPYVRSIFHTPLPDPPGSEKCHYQPISTLDRNLKQFMRPVVVQTISPLMLENFRGILECHYDHLPRRSQDIGAMQTCCSVAPSIEEHEELLPPPRIHSLTDSDIEAMKCEAKLDVIDNTTLEPLYAEIPCWRPPSAHAIEVVNLNGEAVTEL